MLIVNGVLASVIDEPYTNKATGELIAQTSLVFLPSDGEKDTTVVTLDKNQLAQGAGNDWRQIVGKKCSVSVRVWSFKNGGYKLQALGNGKPLTGAAA